MNTTCSAPNQVVMNTFLNEQCQPYGVRSSHRLGMWPFLQGTFSSHKQGMFNTCTGCYRERYIEGSFDVYGYLSSICQESSWCCLYVSTYVFYHIVIYLNMGSCGANEHYLFDWAICSVKMRIPWNVVWMDCVIITETQYDPPMDWL